MPVFRLEPKTETNGPLDAGGGSAPERYLHLGVAVFVTIDVEGPAVLERPFAKKTPEYGAGLGNPEIGGAVFFSRGEFVGLQGHQDLPTFRKDRGQASGLPRSKRLGKKMSGFPGPRFIGGGGSERWKHDDPDRQAFHDDRPQVGIPPKNQNIPQPHSLSIFRFLDEKEMPGRFLALPGIPLARLFSNISETGHQATESGEGVQILYRNLIRSLELLGGKVP